MGKHRLRIAFSMIAGFLHIQYISAATCFMAYGVAAVEVLEYGLDRSCDEGLEASFLQRGMRLESNDSDLGRGVLDKRELAAKDKTRVKLLASRKTSSSHSDGQPGESKYAAIYPLVGSIVFAIFVALLVFLPISDPDRISKKHSALYSVLNPHSHRNRAIIFRSVISSLVLVNIAALLLQSDARYATKHAESLDLLEATSSCVFLIEYIMRVYAIPEGTRYQSMPSWKARLRWMTTFDAIVDLASVCPWILESMFSRLELPTLTWLRVFRLFRLFKVTFISESLDVLARVVYYNAEILLVSLMLAAILVLLLSVALFYCAPKDSSGKVDPQYSSIMACMYLAIMMLTGQGQPEGVLPWYTKLVVCITCIFAVGLFAIQASMLTWGFEVEADRRVKKDHSNRKKQVNAILGGSDPDKMDEGSSSSEDEVDSDWEDYEENIVGDEDFAEDSAQDSLGNTDRRLSAKDAETMRKLFTPKQRRYLLSIFSCLDVNDDGNISKEELHQLKNVDAVHIFKLLGKDQTTSISRTELIGWIASVKKHNSPITFKMILQDLLKACKAKQEAKGQCEDDTAIPPDIMDFGRRFKALQLENEKLKTQLQQMQGKNLQASMVPAQTAS